MKNFRAWNTASRSLTEHMVGALEAIETYNFQAIVRYMPNSEQGNPLQIPAHDLNSPFGWKCTSQFHRGEKEMEQALARALNDTERDLLQNWTQVFGEPEAIKIYQETGVCTAGLFKGIGTCSQVRIKDMVAYLRANGEAERADLWEKPQYFNSGIWTPLTRNYWDVAEGNTYAVYFNENEEGLSKDELHALLDNSIKEIVCK